MSQKNPLPQDEEKQALAHCSKLNTTQKQRHVDTVQQILGVKDEDGTIDIEKFDHELSNTIESMGFDADSKNKVAGLFFEAVQHRVFSEDSRFRQQLLELLNDYSPSAFISDEQLDLVEMLAHHIQELEAAIQYAEHEKHELINDIKAIHEETLIKIEAKKQGRPIRKSNINEDMLEANADNEDALFNEQTKYVDPAMRSYLQYLKPLAG